MDKNESSKKEGRIFKIALGVYALFFILIAFIIAITLYKIAVCYNLGWLEGVMFISMIIYTVLYWSLFLVKYLLYIDRVFVKK